MAERKGLISAARLGGCSPFLRRHQVGSHSDYSDLESQHGAPQAHLGGSRADSYIQLLRLRPKELLRLQEAPLPAEFAEKSGSSQVSQGA